VLARSRSSNSESWKTNADVELFGRLSSGSPRFYKINDSHSYRTRIRSVHRSSPHRINALRLAQPRNLGGPFVEQLLPLLAEAGGRSPPSNAGGQSAIERKLAALERQRAKPVPMLARRRRLGEPDFASSLRTSMT
jgi:hypothetical protein